MDSLAVCCIRAAFGDFDRMRLDFCLYRQTAMDDIQDADNGGFSHFVRKPWILIHDVHYCIYHFMRFCRVYTFVLFQTSFRNG